MKITSIKQQVKRTNRYSIYVDSKYLASLSEGELLKSGLRSGQELDDIALQELKNRASLDKAYMRSLDLISRRMRSEWEIKDYLKRKGYSVEAQAAVARRLNQSRLLDDKKFAEQWVSTRRMLKLSSRRKLAMELRQKHIAADIISDVFGEEEQDDRQVLRDLVELKRRQPKYQNNLKLMQYLSRQGFSYQDIKAALALAE